MTATCTQCQSTNREFAKYCKFCGYEIVSTNGTIKKEFDFDELIGLIELKEKISKKIILAKGMRQDGKLFDKKQLHTILIGNTGTGKSIIPELLAKVYFKNSITSKPDLKTINAVDFTSFSKDLAANLNAEKGGVVFIDNVHLLVPAGYVPGQTTPLDRLYVEMEKQNGDPIIVLSSKLEGFTEYLQENPEVKKKFNLIFELPDLSADDMYELALRILKKQKFNLNPSADVKLTKLFKVLVKNKNKDFGNGHDVRKIIEEEVFEAHYLNKSKYTTDNIIYENDIERVISDDEPKKINTEKLKEQLSTVYCQEDNTSLLVDTLEIWHTQIEKNKPLTTFLVGTSGVGKTFTVESMAKALESDGYEYCYFAMTEFSQEHSVSNLIGSPKGFVGSEEMPKLFEALNRTKKLIICFDEIEKAHEKILKALMQLMDKGFLSWSKGEGDFRQCIICFTSNAQMEKIVELKAKFKNSGRSIESPDFQDAVRDILVRANIAPEVCGRINRFLVYNPLTPEAVMLITQQELKKLAKKYGVEIKYTDPEFLTEMAEKTAGSIYGARPIEDAVLAKLGKQIMAFIKTTHTNKQIEIRKIDEEYKVFEANKSDEEYGNSTYEALTLYRNKKQVLSALDTNNIKNSLSIVFCQEDNTNLLVDTLEIWYAKIEKNKPLTTFLVGTSGVGKTFTVETLAKALEPYGYEYCYFAMTEFSQEHSVSNLIGSPKGFVGSEEKPKLFDALSRTKKLIICFDEIEKAHEKILKALMQLMDKGFLSWSKGEGDFRECIICFTSNAQMDKIVELKAKFKNSGRSVESPDFQDAVRDILVRANIAPEVCGRINRFLVYNPLTPEAVMQITQQELNKLAKDYGVVVKFTVPDFFIEMANKTAGSIYGARPIQDAVSAMMGKQIVAFRNSNHLSNIIEIRKIDDVYKVFEVKSNI